MNTFGKPEWRLIDAPGNAYYICEMLHSSSPVPNILFKPVFFPTNMQDLFGFDITTRKREVNHIIELNGIKHIYLPVYLTDIGARLLDIKKFHFHNYSPMFIVFLCLETSHILNHTTRKIL